MPLPPKIPQAAGALRRAAPPAARAPLPPGQKNTAAIGPDYARVRVGIGRPTVGTVESFVLAGFTKEEQVTLPDVLARAADAVALAVVQGVDAAMNKANVRPKARKA